MNDCTIIGVDTAKSSFALHGADANGQPVLRKTCTRGGFLKFLAKQAPCTVALEVCGGSHHWGREIRQLGHTVKLLTPHDVKPFVKRQKNDANDAAAIVEAASRPTIREVPVKSTATQSQSTLFRSRSLLIRQRTQLANSIRGSLTEYGVTTAKGVSNVRRLRQVVEDHDGAVPEPARFALEALFTAMDHMNEAIDQLEARIRAHVKEGEATRRLMTIPGIGPITAFALTTYAADMSHFRNGREFAAWIGITPREHSTGGRHRTGTITKMGQRDLRALLVTGAMAVFRQARLKPRAASPWLQRMMATKPPKVVAVALANKMARTAWAVSVGHDTYRPHDGRPRSTSVAGEAASGVRARAA